MARVTGPVKRRLVRGAGATAFGVAITLAVQLVAVPAFLHGFGLQLYAEWLLISAVPAYLIISDFGFATVAANEMAMRSAVGDRVGTIRIYRSVWVLMSGLGLVLAGALVASAMVWPPARLLPIRLMSQEEVVLTLALLAAYVVLHLQTGLVEAGFRCIGLFARGTALSAGLRGIDFLAVVGALFAGSGPVGVASAQLGSRACGVVALALLLRVHAPWLTFGVRGSDIGTARALLRPALAYLGFPLGIAFSLQGMVLVVGATIGPAAVVVLNASRTLTSAGRHLVNVVNHAVWPELTAALALSDLSLARRLHAVTVQLTMWMAIALGGVVVVAGPMIVDVWTGSSVSVSRTLLSLLVSVMILDSLWLASSVVLVSVNRHQAMALIFVVTSALAIGASIILVDALNLNGVPLALLLIDIVMLTYLSGATPALLGHSRARLLRELAVSLVFPRRAWRSHSEIERDGAAPDSLAVGVSASDRPV